MEKIAQLTREFEANLPRFNSHMEARSFFKDKFGDAFVMMDSDVIDGEKYYRYYLILDSVAFNDMQKKMREQGHNALDIDRDLSGVIPYQPVEIGENGEIHIVF